MRGVYVKEYAEAALAFNEQRQPFRSMEFVSVIIVSVWFALELPLVLL